MLPAGFRVSNDTAVLNGPPQRGATRADTVAVFQRPVLLACDPRHQPLLDLPTHAAAASEVLPLFRHTHDVCRAFDRGELPALHVGTLHQLARSSGARELLMHLPMSSHFARSALLRQATDAGLRLRVLADGNAADSWIRPATMEDLLVRPSQHIDADRVAALITNNTVLVSGAGGSIGRVLCEEIARFRPARLVLLDQSEYSLYQLDEQFTRCLPGVPRVCLVGDVRSRARMRQIFAEFRPDVVFHAAAYKHVPLLEAHNAWEALRNNVLGTEVMARAAMQTGVRRFVLVSTDKAVNPVSVMGASKRMAEMVCQSLQQTSAYPCFEIVRFGNVIASTGSVIPLFEEQIKRGEALTVTHPDMRRYFMSTQEAARLLLQSATMGQGGEIFVMDMGQPVRVLDVARDMLRLAGEERPDDRIRITGMRPGERLFEELLGPGEETRPSTHPGLHIARARPVEAGWLAPVINTLSKTREPTGWRTALSDWVPEYSRPA